MIRVGGIELYLGPKVLGAPDDLEQVICSFIEEAKDSLAIAVQEIDSETIAHSIIEARQRGVVVRVILEGDYLVETTAKPDPWAIPPDATSHEGNRRIFNAFLRARVDAITDLNPKIFHQKFVVRDAGKPTAAVLTGSTNFTLTDTGKNSGRGGNNLNHVVVLHGQNAASQYLREFERMRSGTFGDLHERVEPRPSEFRLGKVRVKPLFAPRHGPEMEVMKQVLKAEQTIDFAMFTFANSSGIDDTLARMAQVVPPVRIRGVLDRGQGSQKWAATKGLLGVGIELYANRADVGVRKVHHKLMVIDGSLLIVGSFNYTEPASIFNDENIVVLGSLDETDEQARENQQILAGAVLAELERLMADLSRPIPPLEPPPDE